LIYNFPNWVSNW